MNLSPAVPGPRAARYQEFELAVRRLVAGARDEAVRAVEQVDHRIPADLDDFLASPEMAAEYARIERLLTA
ncbi:hypothetical protein [Micromonospora sp. RP3T]|uniref:hypothetical protein n=1 Tax=Micromonospora sp. RP3T TaxID=2135446 RepID=UPI003D75834A